MKYSVKAVLSLVLVLAMMVTATATSVLVGAKELYVTSDTYLEVGSQTCTIDSSADYTAFAFSPTEEGEFTISVSSGLIGIVSYTDMWVQTDPSADNVKDTSVKWDCTAVGQGIYVAVKADEPTVTIQVKAKELIVEEEVPWIIYENKHTPQPFTFDGNFKEMEYVETFDATVDEAVLGEDGFYHLNSATGPVLYACLNDAAMSLADANSYGQLKQVLTDGSGKIYERTDFYEAFDAYALCMDPATGLYPLTEDLIVIFSKVGDYHGWYGAEGFIGGDVADAWMFACYYDEAETVLTTTTADPTAPTTTRTTMGRPTPSAPTTETNTTATNTSADTTTAVGDVNTTAPVTDTTAPVTDTSVSNSETNTTDSVTDTTASSDAVSTTAPVADGTTVTSAADTDTNTEADVTTVVTDANGEVNTTAPVAGDTTSAQASTDPTAAPENATTTTNQVANVGGDSAPTGDVSNAMLFLMIAVIAGAVVTVTAMSKKATN